MQLFGALLSPFVRKAALAAAEKGIDYEMVMAGPANPTPEFKAASPFGKMPAMKDGQFNLADSTAIVVYLDARHPAVPLLPADPELRGRAMWFDEFTDTIFGASALKILFNRFVAPRFLKIEGDEEAAKAGEKELPRSFDYLESVVPESGWLLGDFTLADISVASMFKTLSYVGIGPDAAKYPRTAAWYARVSERPAWRKVAGQEAAR